MRRPTTSSRWSGTYSKGSGGDRDVVGRDLGDRSGADGIVPAAGEGDGNDGRQARPGACARQARGRSVDRGDGRGDDGEGPRRPDRGVLPREGRQVLPRRRRRCARQIPGMRRIGLGGDGGPRHLRLPAHRPCNRRFRGRYLPLRGGKGGLCRQRAAALLSRRTRRRGLLARRARTGVAGIGRPPGEGARHPPFLAARRHLSPAEHRESGRPLPRAVDAGHTRGPGAHAGDIRGPGRRERRDIRHRGGPRLSEGSVWGAFGAWGGRTAAEFALAPRTGSSPERKGDSVHYLPTRHDAGGEE